RLLRRLELVGHRTWGGPAGPPPPPHHWGGPGGPWRSPLSRFLILLTPAALWASLRGGRWVGAPPAGPPGGLPPVFGVWGFADRVADLDRHGERRLRGHRLERLEVVLERAVERVGALGLREADPRQLVDEAELLHHQEPLAERVDVAEVAAGDHDPVRHFPVE